MSDNKRNLANIIVFTAFILGMSIWCILSPDKEISDSERRYLAKKPALTYESVFSDKAASSFMEDFEEYATDQFVLRDGFRTVNSMFLSYVLGRKEVNDLYISDGYIIKIQDEVDEESVAWSVDRIKYIKSEYLENSNIYLSIIPDKSYYAENAGYPSSYYDEIAAAIRSETDSFAEYIDISGELSLENYYMTDTHWKQESLTDVARCILNAMADGDYVSEAEFTENTLEGSFKGVYYGQLALPATPDTIKYLTSDYMEYLTVKSYDTGLEEEIDIYDYEKADGTDRYEFFLSGSLSLITIENPCADTDKELVIFRDSYASSLTPLLCSNYSRVTLVDIRYISPAFLGRFVEFDGADVLFLYCSELLNTAKGQFLK